MKKLLLLFVLIFQFQQIYSQSVIVKVANSNDDAEESISSGSIDLTSSDLELTLDGSVNQIVGIRFQNVQLPKGAIITKSYIQFTVDEVDSEPTSLMISGELNENSQAFNSENKNISNRSKTNAAVAWADIPSWAVGDAGQNQATPDLTAIINEIRTNTSWSSGNSLAFIISGTGSRTAESYDGVKESAPVLIIEYTSQSAEELFFAPGQEWKYLDNGSDQGTAWRESSFDDSSWKTGKAELGFGEGDENTTLTKGFITYYFRKSVTINDISKLNKVFFNLKHDDGAVAYVNGKEVLRSALMPSGAINYQTGTTTFIPNAEENSFFTYNIDASYFVNGENTIAVEVHNQTPTSSDVSFDLFVTNKTNYTQDGPYVYYRNDKIIVKSITEDGVKEETFNAKDNIILTCKMPEGLHDFSFPLRNDKANLGSSSKIEPSESELPQKYLAISDLEGNIEASIFLFQKAGIIDQNYDWSYGNGHLYLVGDLFDRGQNVTELLWLIYKLEAEAENAGGKVHYVLGNHDIMNIIGDFRYVSSKYEDTSGLLGETLLSLHGADSELGQWIRSKNIIEKAGRSIFVHGGLHPTVASLNLTYDQINDFGRQEMNGTCTSDDCKVINNKTSDKVGIYWDRQMSEQLLTQQEVDETLANFDADIIIVGHQIYPDITPIYNKKVYEIDLNHAENYNNGFMSALYQENGCIYKYTTNQPNELFDCKSVLSTSEQSSKPDLLTIYPNPTSEYIKINAGSGKLNSIELYNSIGQKQIIITNFKTDHYAEVNLHYLPKGVYYLVTNLGNKTVIKR